MKAAILKTLHYADLFDYPLTLEELYHFLIEKQTNKNELEATLSELVSSGTIDVKGSYYFLDGRDALAGLREERKKWSQLKLKRAEKVAKILKVIPWLKMVALTGALAMKNCAADDDIDLLFITAPKRLWLSRGLIVIFLRMFGLYRRPDKIKNKICPNVWLSSEALEFKEKTLFTAHELAQAAPLWDRSNFYQQIIKKNSWLNRFLPNWKISFEMIGDTTSRGRTPDSSLKRIFSLLLDHFDLLAYKLQLRYMSKKRTKETVGRHIALFHPLDTQNYVLARYEQKVKSL